MKSLSYFTFVLFFLLSTICFAGPSIYLDEQKTIGVTISENSGHTTASLQIFKFSLSDLSKNLIGTLKESLKIYVNGKPVSLVLKKDTASSGIGFFSTSQSLSSTQVELKLGDRTISEFSISENGQVINIKNSPISSYDLRQISEIGSQYLNKIKKSNGTPGTVVDLHTHFGGALRGESIVKVAYKLGLAYPTAFLKEMGVSFDSTKVNEKNEIKISDLDSKSLYKLIDNLNLNTLKVENFTRMEVYYKYRSPLVKSMQAFPHFLRELALDYKTNGVKYAELSISDVLKPEWLELVHQHMPQIEKETGVKIRFLAALWRHSDPLFNSDMIERLKILQSPYVVGVDFMGHESNSSWELESAIKKSVELKKTISPSWQTRVHAGENPYYPENVRVAIELGADRIGHALYADDAAITLARERGTIFEINPDSNFALNNNDGAEKAPLNKFLSAGVNITVGTDGHGLYGINHKNLLQPLSTAGVAASDLSQVVQRDTAYINKMDEMFQKREHLLSQPVSRNLPRAEYTEAYEKQQTEKRKSEKKELISSIKNKGIAIHENTESLEIKFHGMSGIWISGASKSSFPKIAPEDQLKIEQMLLNDLKRLDPSKVFLLMGATHFGVEEIIMRLNDQHKLGFRIIGVVAENKSETRMDDIGKVTDAIFMGKNWFDKVGTLVPFVKKNKILTFFIGGGGVVRDEIQAAKNGGLDFHLLKGPWGASTDMSTRYPSHVFGYADGIAGVVQSKNSALIRSVKFVEKSNMSKIVKEDSSRTGAVLKCIQLFR